MQKYNHLEVEKKWQKFWEENKTFKVDNNTDKEKLYLLIEFPYPSGQGLHVGHPRPYTALDIVARQQRLAGKAVLFPMGWDAFGLPTENFAIKNKIHPSIVTEKNVARFKSQLKSLGLSFDWDREINTTDPEYYKWTQWIFIQMFKKGLAYKKEMSVNWCTSCKCVLANEEVVDGHCERCGSEVVRKVKSQWMLKITEYADRLLEDLDMVDFIPRVKMQQKNWIGKSEGASIKFNTTSSDELEVFTTRPDTIYGVTYMVIAPESEFVDKWKDKISNYDELIAYRSAAAKKSDLERSELNKNKTGVEIKGVRAIHPFTSEELPIFIADYVLSGYGTGAIMAVPAHDQRDFDFADKYGLNIKEVVASSEKDYKTRQIEEGLRSQDGELLSAYTGDAASVIINSDSLNGLNIETAKQEAIRLLENQGIGNKKVNYKLRDWIFSRQRYWGEPIPIVHCEKCGHVAISEDELPLKLPMTDHYEPSDNGESPLAKMTEWVNCKCPKCGGPATRETDTMPQWAGSSWYYLRYTDPNCDYAPASKEALQEWLPVDWYNGGMEHTTLHLLYSRFWHKFLYDIGVVNTPEPYMKRTSHGMILGSDGEKMSKSRGNVINPDELIEEFGADTVRVYEMFIGDFEKAAPWNERGVIGVRRFLERVSQLPKFLVADEALNLDEDGYVKEHTTLTHQTIKKVTDDILGLKMNTAIAQLMTFTNKIYEDKKISLAELQVFLTLLNPFAPHLSEELYEENFSDGPISSKSWIKYDERKCVEDEIEIVVQINGKIKKRLNVASDMGSEDMIKLAKTDEEISSLIKDKTIIKEIAVPKRLVNFVVR